MTTNPHTEVPADFADHVDHVFSHLLSDFRQREVIEAREVVRALDRVEEAWLGGVTHVCLV